MKKLLSIVLAIVLLGVAPFSAVADGEGRVEITPSVNEVQPGDTFTASMDVTSNPGVMFFSFTPSYDRDKLELVSMVGANSSWTCVTSANWDGANDETFTGSMVTLTFRVKESAQEGAVGISGSVEAFNYNEQEIAFAVIAGSVMIRSGGASEASIPVTGGDAPEIVPTITEDEGTHVKTATAVPIALTDTNEKTASIKQSDIAAYIAETGVDVIEIVSGLGATAGIGEIAAPQVQITDDNGNVLMKTSAKGGQLRIDKKMNGNTIVGDYATTNDKASAIDYVDIRLQYEFTLPEGVSVTDGTTSWFWTLRYGTKTKTVSGEKYLPVAGKANTYTSNVVITNVPLEAVTDSFKAALTLTYVKDGVTYRIVQAEETPLIRTITGLVDYYMRDDVIGQLSENVQIYVRTLAELISSGTWTPVA